MVDSAALGHRLRRNVETVAERYFVDASERRVAGTDVHHWNVVLGALGYLSDGNVLLVGEPGTGKTTFANVVASAFTGLPYDLFAGAQIQGHPDQTKAEMFARPHVGRLTNEGREDVVWQHTLFLPQVLVDEYNRLPPGKQSIAQEFVRTGTLSHLNEVFTREDLSFAATVNESDDGTYDLTPPTLDRFDVSLEFTHGAGWSRDRVEDAWANVQAELADEAATRELMDRLSRDDPAADYEEKLAFVADWRRERAANADNAGLSPFTPEEEAAFQEAVEDVPIEGDARTFLDFLYDEVNQSSTGTHKRRGDDPQQHTHDQGLAYSKVVNGVSARRRRAVTTYARALAFYLGDDAVTRDHLRAITPHCLAHAVEFTEDFRAEHAQSRRWKGAREEFHLAGALLEDVEENYDDLAETVKLLNAAVAGDDLDDEQRAEVEQFLAGPEPDHPHLREWLGHLRGADFDPDAGSEYESDAR